MPEGRRPWERETRIPEMQDSRRAAERRTERERLELLHELEDWLETPMVVLGFVWLALLVVELVWGINPFLEQIGTTIWGVFVVDFGLKLIIAPNKLAYLKESWLTALALLLPALRVFRVVRALRLLRAARAARGVRLFRLFTSLNRGMRALRATLGRRGFGYVSILTVAIVMAGGAAMYALEAGVPDGGFRSYADAVWWTAMLMTTLGSEYWPKSAEGRFLCFLLSMYAVGVFGYVTATLATFFIGRDAERADTEMAGTAQIEELRQEIRALRGELRGYREARTDPHDRGGSP